MPYKRKPDYPRIKNFRQRTKLRAIEYKGGKCIVCGYYKCITALEFHHTNPTEKLFPISMNLNKAWHKIQSELDKCVLVCANCHREIAEGLVTV